MNRGQSHYVLVFSGLGEKRGQNERGLEKRAQFHRQINCNSINVRAGTQLCCGL